MKKSISLKILIVGLTSVLALTNFGKADFRKEISNKFEHIIKEI